MRQRLKSLTDKLSQKYGMYKVLRRFTQPAIAKQNILAYQLPTEILRYVLLHPE
ncbi:hypothetical protein [Hydrococcus rivularis]|uniref:hypothetical protein n=1 Tax=Hydrococcus rivularis TaxID=1616834 RepID=UPI000B18AE71|nr:hypothetical protein [Hydrococcus rivularis]